jgi:hypothetical protein
MEFNTASRSLFSRRKSQAVFEYIARRALQLLLFRKLRSNVSQVAYLNQKLATLFELNQCTIRKNLLRTPLPPGLLDDTSQRIQKSLLRS